MGEEEYIGKKIQTRNRQPSSPSHGEIIVVPDEMKGRVIGKRGWFLHHIRERTGAHLTTCHGGFFVKGNEMQIEHARQMITDKLKETNSIHKAAPMTNQKMLSYIPENLKGLIIGKDRENFARISTETGAKLQVRERNIYVDGSPDAERKAHIRIKEQLCGATEVWLLKKVKKVLMDSTNLTREQDLNLVSVSGVPWAGQHYRLELIDENDAEENLSTESDLEENVKETFLEVLRGLHEQESLKEFELDFWCHFGHAFIGNVDEGDEGEVSIEAVKRKVESGEWKERFRGGLEDAEISELEDALSEKVKSSSNDIRHDFYFYTPSARKAKVKTWLMKEDGSEDTMAFSLAPPYPLRGIRKRVFYGDPTEEKTSRRPCFFLCAPYQKVLIVDVVAPASNFDCRYVLRASEKEPDSCAEAEEEDKELCEYLSAMRIVGDKIILPQDRQLPEDFQLHYVRRSVRRTCEYPSEGGTFIITVSQESQKEGDELQSHDDTPSKTDVLLHFEDWSTATEGNMSNLKHASSKCSHFMRFVRNVQQIIKHG